MTTSIVNMFATVSPLLHITITVNIKTLMTNMIIMHAMIILVCSNLFKPGAGRGEGDLGCFHCHTFNSSIIVVLVSVFKNASCVCLSYFFISCALLLLNVAPSFRHS